MNCLYVAALARTCCAQRCPMEAIYTHIKKATLNLAKYILSIKCKKGVQH